MSKESIIILGSNGQLGKSLQYIIEKKDKVNYNFVFLSREQSDITDIVLLEDTFKKYQPKYIINCAAYTQVDLAEDNKEEAYKVNVTGVKNLAVLCDKYEVALVYISTDFVFEGKEAIIRKEIDACKPINYYGLSKLKGEKEVEGILKNYFIIRTSWLYSEFGNNFVKTMLRLSKEKEELGIIYDQIGSPTYAVDLANFIFTVIEKESKKFGVYHYSNEGLCSWYDFAKAIFEYKQTSIKVIPVTSLEFKTKALRPKFSVMSKEKVKSNFNVEVNHWRDSLKKCLNKIQ